MPDSPRQHRPADSSEETESAPLAEQMAEFLQARGCSVWIGSAWDEPEALANVAGLDLLVTLGGDGTMLRAARVGSRDQVPLVGVKLGKVSFLAEITPEDWERPLEQILSGEYWLEERMLLDVAVTRDGRAARQPLVPRDQRRRHQPRRPGAHHLGQDVGRPELPDDLPGRRRHRLDADRLHRLRARRRRPDPAARAQEHPGDPDLPRTSAWTGPSSWRRAQRSRSRRTPTTRPS